MRRARPQRRRRGAAALEFALIAPVLVTVFGAIVELSLYISTLHRVNRVARDAARVGSVVIEGPEATGDQIELEARDHALLAMDAADLTCTGGCQVETTWALDSDLGYRFLTVDITYPFPGLTGMMPELAERGLRARFSMVTQQQ